MTTPSLTAAGFTAPRAADYLVTVETSFETDTGTTPDWERDTVLGNLSAVMADRLDEVTQVGQAGYDARRRATATGIQLDDIGAIIGVYRQEATHSRATVTITGTSGIIVPTGFLVEGGGTADDERWATIQDYTLVDPGTGIFSASAIVQAVNEGAIVATIAQINQIVTPMVGVTAVSNPAAATPGDDRETDANYRLRQQASLQISGSASVNAIRAKLVQLPYVESAIVVENDDFVYALVDGIVMPPCSEAVILWPNTLSTTEQDAVAELIYTHTPAGTQAIGSVGRTVTKSDGVSKIIYWDWATADDITVAIVTVAMPGYSITDYHSALSASIVAYFANLLVGQGVTVLDMNTLAGEIIDTNTGGKMIKSLTVNLGGLGIGVDYPGVATVLVTLTAGNPVIT